jgi:hypothetical protein
MPPPYRPAALTDAEFAAIAVEQLREIYTPSYSHINIGHSGAAFPLAVTLAVRNTDAESAIVLYSVDYFDTAGTRVRKCLDRPVRLPAMATYEVFVGEDDVTGGVGASFRMTWTADASVSEPLVEAVHTGTGSGQGVSFVTRGVAVVSGVDVQDRRER